VHLISSLQSLQIIVSSLILMIQLRAGIHDFVCIKPHTGHSAVCKLVCNFVCNWLEISVHEAEKCY